MATDFIWSAKRQGLGLHITGAALACQKCTSGTGTRSAGAQPHRRQAAARSRAADARAAAKTFAECGASYIDMNSPEWANIKHLAMRTTIEAVANPVIGNLLVQEVDTPHIMAILEPIWKTKTEAPVRVRGRLESMLDWATVRGHRAGLNPARWKGHLSAMLPAPGKVANAEHHAALPYVEMPGFMARLRAVEDESAQALQLIV